MSEFFLDYNNFEQFILKEIDNSASKVLHKIIKDHKEETDSFYYIKSDDKYKLTSICLNCFSFHDICKIKINEKYKLSGLNYINLDGKKILCCSKCKCLVNLPIIDGSYIFEKSLVFGNEKSMLNIIEDLKTFFEFHRMNLLKKNKFLFE